jgi:hypothetical protein
MSNYHDMAGCQRRAFWVKQPLRRQQILPKLFGALEDRRAGGIQKEPGLIVRENLRIRTKIIRKVFP